MGIRDVIQKSPTTTVSVVALIIIGAIAVSAYTLRSDTSGPQMQAYFSDDDGKTWFVDSVEKIVPFDHDGKQAVMAKMFTCDDGKTKFVGYLQRYSPDIQKRLLASQAVVAGGGKATLSTTSMEVSTNGTEIKRPGDLKWVSSNDIPAKLKITDHVPCPTGGILDSVVP